MSHAAHGTSVPASLSPTEGWHCTHMYYRFDRLNFSDLEPDHRAAALGQFEKLLTPGGPDQPARLQTSIVSGHKADFGFIALDADPLKVNSVHQRLMASPIGLVLEPTYSFVSITEVSEYVPTLEQYGQRLVAEGDRADSPGYAAKLKAYEQREIGMRHQRLTPDLPEWPCFCFYPMNKKRKVDENWFLLNFADRSRLMGEHGRSGMAFAGRVSQLITVALGFDDWEWGVSLWARNPEYLKEIVYKMRFDEASARYAEFGPFYVSYPAAAAAILEHCGL